MFAAACNRVDAIKLLARRGADVKATSKVVDLYELTREEPPRPGQGGGTGAPDAAARPAPRGRGQRRALDVRRSPVSTAATTTPS